MAKKAAAKKSEKSTFLMLRIPPNPKSGSVATIEIVATSAAEAKKQMRANRVPQSGAEYCLVKVEDQFTYRTTYTAQKAKISFGETDDANP
jgi:hypothetical protein